METRDVGGRHRCGRGRHVGGAHIGALERRAGDHHDFLQRRRRRGGLLRVRRARREQGHDRQQGRRPRIAAEDRIVEQTQYLSP
jgi:hypothetical protein